MIQGLSHLTFIVRDLDRMEEVVTKLFGGRKVYDSGSETFSLSKERFFLVGDEENAIWIATMEGDPLESRSYNHVAFKIDDEKYEAYRQQILDLGLSLREGRQRIGGEGRSLYFYDDDNHLFEFHTGTLNERLRTYDSSV